MEPHPGDGCRRPAGTGRLAPRVRAAAPRRPDAGLSGTRDGAPRLGLCLLPTPDWPRLGDWAERAEAMGFSSVWVYDHYEWRGMAGAPWLTAVPLLAAIAVRTTGVRIGTMVATPNLHHPVALAKEAVALDRISGGRLTLGLGAGSTRSDAEVLGERIDSAADRAERFEEWVAALDALLRSRGRVTLTGRYHASGGVLMAPGPVQRPRPPFAVAATAARGMNVVARFADAWVTLDDPRGDSATVEESAAALADQVRRIDAACAAAGRDPATLRRVLLTGMGPNRPLASDDALHDCLRRARELRFGEVILHEPRSRDPHSGDLRVLERAVGGATAGQARRGDGRPPPARQDLNI